LLRTTGAGRYFMLETIRAFAVERFAEEPNGETVLGRHAHHFAELVPQLEPGLHGGDQRGTIERLNAELPNIRQALDTLHREEDPRPEASLAGAGSSYWYLTAQLVEGYARCRAAHDRMDGRDAPERGEIANACSLLAFMAGELERAALYADEALELSRRHDD